jgi:hypothetical protein
VPRGTIWRPQTLFDHDAAMHTAARAVRRLVFCAAALLATTATADEPSAEQAIAPREQPIRFKLVHEWTAAGVSMPGTIVCLDDDEARSAAEGLEPAVAVVVLDGRRTVVVLDARGRELARHSLRIPDDAEVHCLRTAVDSRRKRWWLGVARAAPRVFLFDDVWTLRATYPSPDGPAREPIGGAQLADCDGDGSPEIVVAFGGAGGVEAASLDGRRLWHARSIAAVGDVALDAPRPAGGRGLVCTDGLGRLTRIAADGVAGAARMAGSRGIHRLFGGPVAPDAAWALVGFAACEDGGTEAVGIGPDLERAWSLELCRGPHRAGPIEPVAWANLLGTQRRQWLIAAADGSVTVAWADGGVVDRYRHGAVLVGIGGYRHDNGGHIVIATPEAVECHRLDDVALD